MQKEYRISTGQNLGNTGSRAWAGIDTSNYAFSGSISNIFNDPEIKGNLVYSFFGKTSAERNKGFIAFTSGNKEWQDWNDKVDNENLRPTQDERRNKMFEIAQRTYGQDFDNHVKNAMDQINQEYSPMFEKLETLYRNAMQETTMPDKLKAENGIADFGDKPLLLHNIPLVDEEGLEARKDLGIIASEWFGKTESYGECRFCVSFTKTRGITFETQEQQQEQSQSDDQCIDDEPKKKKSPMLTYIIDPQTPAVEQLVKMDLWKYARNKESNNFEMYTQDEQHFLEQLYSWSAPKKDNSTVLNLLAIAGNASGIAKDKPTWVAIPGGMPTKNTIAIQAKDFDHSPELIQLVKQACEMHQVPIIDQQGKIIMGEQFLAKENLINDAPRSL